VGGDAELVERLRGGDQEAFETLTRRYHTTMIGLAAAYVPTRAAAEEVVQDSWMGMLRGLDRFGGRVSLKTWLFGILVDRARIASERERRSIPVAVAALGPARFVADGSWVRPPVPWPGDIDERLRAPAAQQGIRAAIEALPPGPRSAVLLRDVEGMSSREVCEVLGISETSQRVLLHRGRSRIRQALEQQVGRV